MKEEILLTRYFITLWTVDYGGVEYKKIAE